MKRRMRALWIVVILIAVLVGGGGCYMIGGKMFSSNAGKDMLRHMEEKYGEEFVADALTLANYLDSYDRLFCHPKWGTLEADRVTVKRFKKDGGYEYHDTYFSIIIRDEVEQMVKEICKEVSVDADVYYVSGDYDYFDDEYDHSKTYQDVIDSGEYIGMDVDIIIEDKDGLDHSRVKDMVFTRLRERNIQGVFTIAFAPRELMEQATREDRSMLQDETGAEDYWEIIKLEGDEDGTVE